VEIETKEGDWLVTCGLAGRGIHELAVRETRPDWQEEARALLNNVYQYLVSSGNRIRPAETMNYGFWLIKFCLDDRSLLVIHECDDTGANFVVGCSTVDGVLERPAPRLPIG